jgi:hypothetical protein
MDSKKRNVCRLEVTKTERVLGSELEAGDIIRVWWGTNYDKIVNITFPDAEQKKTHKGKVFASFKNIKENMTIDLTGNYDRVVK